MLPQLSCPSIFILPACKISWLESALPLYGKFISIIYDTWFIGTFNKLVFCSSELNIRLLVNCDELTQIDADFGRLCVCVCARVHSLSVADPGFSPGGGGALTPKIAIIFHIFAENCMKMKEFGPPGGGARPWRPPWIRQWLCNHE